jgi:hypothetical protein
VLDAYGGVPVLERYPVVVQEGTVTSAMRGGGEGRIVRIFERPLRLRVTITYSGEQEQRILDGAAAWREGRPVQGPAYFAMVLQAARLGLPLLLRDAAAALRDGGAVERDGVALRAIHADLGDGISMTVEVEAVTARILRSTVRYAGPDGGVEFSTAYSDFRKVAGILVPFREENAAQGRRTGETRLTRVEFLPEAIPSAFRP